MHARPAHRRPLALALTLLVLLSVVGLAPARPAEAFPYATVARFYNASQIDSRWAATEMIGDHYIGRCGCQLSAYTAMMWRELNATPGPAGTPPQSSQPHFPSQVNDFEIVVDLGFYRRRVVVDSTYQAIFSPHYLDRYLREPIPEKGLGTDWGYAIKGDEIGCGAPVRPWAMEHAAVPSVAVIETADGPQQVEIGPTGIEVDIYDGLNTAVIDRNLAQGKPTIVGRQYWNADGSQGGHFQVVTGWSEHYQQYRYTDPVWATGANSQAFGDPRAYHKWTTEVVQTVDVRPAFGGRQHLVMEDDPAPIELSAVLPDGQLVGYDPATGERVATPGNYMYSLFSESPADGSAAPAVDPIRGLMTTANPVGVTRTRIIGTASGPYSVDLFDIGADGSRTDLGTVGGTIAEGQEVKHEVTYAEDGSVAAVEVANFTPEPVVAHVEAVAGEPATLDASASFDLDGTITATSWDLGDGTTATGPQVPHTWAAPGTYAASVTVVDDAGASRTEAITVEVRPSELDAPAVTATVAPDGARDGWSSAPQAVVDVAATDTGSGVAELTTSASGAEEQAPTTTPDDHTSVVVHAEGRTTVTALARDRMGNVSGAEVVEVGLDRTAPTATVRTPAPDQPVSRLSFIGGTAADGLSGVAAVEVALRAPDGRWWDGSGWTADEAWSPAAGTTAWHLAGLPEGLPDGTYEVRALAVDVAGNRGTEPVVHQVQVAATATGRPVTELEVPAGAHTTEGYDVDADGTAVGVARTGNLTDQRAVAFDDGQPQLLPVPAGRVGAHGQASDGGVVGGWSVDQHSRELATLWVGDQVLTFPPPSGTASSIIDVRADGTAVGSATYTSGLAHRRAARFAGGSAVPIDDLDGSMSEARALNDAGDVVGWSDTPGAGSEQRAFLLPSGGSAIELPSLGLPDDPEVWSASTAVDINDAGQIVGMEDGHAVRWDDLVPVDLGPGEATAIAEDGTVVGVRYHDDSARAALWDGAGALDLNALVDAGSGWVLDRAEGISDDGRYVTGLGTLHGEPRGFVLDLGGGGGGGGGGDDQAPTSTASAPDGWVVGPATVQLHADDGEGSGVDRIATSLGDVDGHGGTVVVEADGEHVVAHAAIDRAGNHGGVGEVAVRVDATPPTATLAVPAPPASGWHPGSVEVAVDGRDATSGLARLEVRVDGAAPQVVAPGPFTIEGDGERSVEVVAVDHAGNRSQPAIATVPIDGQGPAVLVHEPTAGTVEPGAPVLASASDEGSGVASLDLAVVSDDGTRTPVTSGALLTSLGPLQVEATATDHAGNRTTQVVAVEVVDGDAPPPPADGTNLAPVADAGGPYVAEHGELIVLDATGSTDPEGDELTYEWRLDGDLLDTDATVPMRLDPGTYLLTLTVHDGQQSSPLGREGDVRSVTTITVLPDGEAPEVELTWEAPDGDDGWHRHSPVTGTVQVDDRVTGDSAITSLDCEGASVGPLLVDGATATAPLTAAGGEVTCTAVDAAGNEGTATSVVPVDADAPVVTAVATPVEVVVGGTLELRASATDAGGSGLVGPPTCEPVDTSGPGERQATCTARDTAGNVGHATVTYRVLAHAAPPAPAPSPDPTPAPVPAPGVGERPPVGGATPSPAIGVVIAPTFTG